MYHYFFFLYHHLANKKKGGKKKSNRLKDEFKMDIKDMIVKKRLASLNASAIMSASYAQERPLGKAELGAGASAAGHGGTTAALVPYSASQAAMALKKAKKESLAEAAKVAAAAAAKLASSSSQKGKLDGSIYKKKPNKTGLYLYLF